MNKLVLMSAAALILAAGVLVAAEPVKSEPSKNKSVKCKCTGADVCKCDPKKKCKCTSVQPAAQAAPVRQNIIKRATNPILDQQKKRDQKLVEQGLL